MGIYDPAFDSMCFPAIAVSIAIIIIMVHHAITLDEISIMTKKHEIEVAQKKDKQSE
jgi:hypothetical protein